MIFLTYTPVIQQYDSVGLVNDFESIWEKIENFRHLQNSQKSCQNYKL